MSHFSLKAFLSFADKTAFRGARRHLHQLYLPCEGRDPSQFCKIIRHKLRWSRIGGKSMRHKLPWSSCELGQLFLSKSFCFVFSDLGFMFYICVFMHVRNFFWEGAHSHVSGGPPNQAWHHTRGLICYPTLISTLPATSTTPPSWWSGPDLGSNQSILMVNSFQSCAKPIISHPEPTESQVKLVKAGGKNDKGHPQAGIIYHHRLRNVQQSTLVSEILTT